MTLPFLFRFSIPVITLQNPFKLLSQKNQFNRLSNDFSAASVRDQVREDKYKKTISVSGLRLRSIFFFVLWGTLARCHLEDFVVPVTVLQPLDYALQP